MKTGFCLLLALAAACGGDDDGGGGADGGTLENPGFATPDTVTTAFTKDGEIWNEVGPANWSCLNTASDDMPSTVAINLTGIVRDFQNDDDVIADAVITAYDGNDITGNPLATATSEADGSFALTLEAGVERVAFKMSAKPDYLDTYLLNQYYDPGTAEQTEDQLEPISVSLANTLTAFINKERTLGLGVLAGAIRDCDDNEVAGAIATVSASRGTADHVDGAETYYFSAGSRSLPVRLSQQAYTNDDGLFMAIELPPSQAEYYLQVWGFLPDQDPASDELTLIAEIGTSVIGDTVISASMEALRQ
jgi:hypothetical protein